MPILIFFISTLFCTAPLLASRYLAVDAPGSLGPSVHQMGTIIEPSSADEAEDGESWRLYYEQGLIYPLDIGFSVAADAMGGHFRWTWYEGFQQPSLSTLVFYGKQDPHLRSRTFWGQQTWFGLGLLQHLSLFSGLQTMHLEDSINSKETLFFPSLFWGIKIKFFRNQLQLAAEQSMDLNSEVPHASFVRMTLQF